ncbi:MAG: type II toxin-antitoxin system VapC family toxin [Thermosynechococcaceae cyanobacterium]
MKYLLDTDHISILQRRSGLDFTRLAFRIAQHPPTDFALSIVSFHEQILGAHTFVQRARTDIEIMRGYTLLQETLQGFAKAPVLSFDNQAIVVFNTLKNQQIRVSTMDLRIAAIALSQNLVLLTRNISDFGRITSLLIEDWTL